MQEIPDDKLRQEDVPEALAEWDTISRFALTFNGYQVWGSFEACAEVAETKQPETLTVLRTCLFYEQRRWRHLGEIPDAESMQYIRLLLERIRDHVTRSDNH